jgi:hypothetical protein
MNKYSADFEQLYIPIFEFMVDPSKITFEDSILIILKNFIQKTRSVSDIIFKVFPCLENVFIKNKLKFGDILLETLNIYLIHGRDQMMNNPASIQMLVKIADQAIFTFEPNIIVNNSEGAILMQIIFQIFEGTDVLNNYFVDILTRILERMNNQPLKTSLKKHLLQVFISALIYNASAVLKIMEMKGITKNILSEILALKKNYKRIYEQKCFIIGMTNIIKV